MRKSGPASRSQIRLLKLHIDKRLDDLEAKVKAISVISPMQEAAPDLYAALADIEAAHCGMPKSCGHDYECVCTGNAARAALAKARGEK